MSALIDSKVRIFEAEDVLLSGSSANRIFTYDEVKWKVREATSSKVSCTFILIDSEPPYNDDKVFSSIRGILSNFRDKSAFFRVDNAILFVSHGENVKDIRAEYLSMSFIHDELKKINYNLSFTRHSKRIRKCLISLLSSFSREVIKSSDGIDRFIDQSYKSYRKKEILFPELVKLLANADVCKVLHEFVDTLSVMLNRNSNFSEGLVDSERAVVTNRNFSRYSKGKLIDFECGIAVLTVYNRYYISEDAQNPLFDDFYLNCIRKFIQKCDVQFPLPSPSQMAELVKNYLDTSLIQKESNELSSGNEFISADIDKED